MRLMSSRKRTPVAGSSQGRSFRRCAPDNAAWDAIGREIDAGNVLDSAAVRLNVWTYANALLLCFCAS